MRFEFRNEPEQIGSAERHVVEDAGAFGNIVLFDDIQPECSLTWLSSELWGPVLRRNPDLLGLIIKGARRAGLTG